MRLLATELSSAVEEMTATNEGLATASKDVSNRLEELSNFAESMTGDIEQINVIVHLVKRFSYEIENSWSKRIDRSDTFR